MQQQSIRKTGWQHVHGRGFLSSYNLLIKRLTNGLRFSVFHMNIRSLDKYLINTKGIKPILTLLWTTRSKQYFRNLSEFLRELGKFLCNMVLSQLMQFHSEFRNFVPLPYIYLSWRMALILYQMQGNLWPTEINDRTPPSRRSAFHPNEGTYLALLPKSWY